MSEYTVRVCIAHNDGSTSHRMYVRPASSSMSREAFNAFAMGDMLTLIATNYTDSLRFAPSQSGTSFPLDTISAIGIERVDAANTIEDIDTRFIKRYCDI